MAMSIKEAVVVVSTMGSSMSGEIRSMLLQALRRSPQTVGALAEAVKQGQPLVSHHLKLMAQAGVVVKQRDGRSVTYGVNGDAFSKLSKAADLLAAAPKLPELKAKVEEVKADAPKAEETDEVDAPEVDTSEVDETEEVEVGADVETAVA